MNCVRLIIFHLALPALFALDAQVLPSLTDTLAASSRKLLQLPTALLSTARVRLALGPSRKRAPLLSAAQKPEDQRIAAALVQIAVALRAALVVANRCRFVAVT